MITEVQGKKITKIIGYDDSEAPNRDLLTPVNMLGIRPLGRRLCGPGKELIPIGGQDQLVATHLRIRVRTEEYNAHPMYILWLKSDIK